MRRGGEGEENVNNNVFSTAANCVDPPEEERIPSSTRAWGNRWVQLAEEWGERRGWGWQQQVGAVRWQLAGNNYTAKNRELY